MKELNTNEIQHISGGHCNLRSSTPLLAAYAAILVFGYSTGEIDEAVNLIRKIDSIISPPKSFVEFPSPIRI